jgi:Tfp pilus assembly protein PilF
MFALTAAEKPALQAEDAAKLKHAAALLDAYRGDASSLAAAGAEIDRVIAANPRHAPAYRELARYRMMSGHIKAFDFQPGSLEAADAALAKAIEIDPAYAEAYVLRGQLYRLLGRRDDALAALQKAESLGTSDPWLQNNWADLLLDDGKFAEAAARYRKVVDSKTTNMKAMIAAIEGLIDYYSNAGQVDKMDELYRRQIELEPRAARTQTGYAQFLLCQKGDYEASIARSRQALALESSEAGRYWLAAGLYLKWAQSVIDKKAEAGKTYYDQAQAIYPGVDEVLGNASSCPPLDTIAKAIELRDEKHAPPPAAAEH